MKFTILGSTGFIGSNLTNYLKKNWHNWTEKALKI